MGGNYYVKGFIFKGTKTANGGTVITHKIDPVKGARHVVTAYGATCSTTAADRFAFLRDISQATSAPAIATAALSGVSTVVLNVDPLPAGAAIAANDNVVIEQDNGTYLWTTINTWTGGTKTAILNNALTANCAVGRRVWCLGISTDTDNWRRSLASASTQYTSDTNNPIFGTTNIWEPLMVYHLNAGTTAGTIDYVGIQQVIV